MPCPVCGGTTIATVARAKLPALQNRVYDTPAEAQAARYGKLDLQACTACGYAYNAAFDPAIMQYDEHYDNAVPSAVFMAYYREIAAYLHAKYLPTGGLVVDAGCGKGTFLQVMTSMFADVRGLGIDPSCQAGSNGNLTLIADIFSPRYLTESPALLVCRHTLEHIPEPTGFLKSLRDPLPEGTPVFIEVPDADWIIGNGAFWDFCYEHVNYFTADSAAQAMARAGIHPISQTQAFGKQYLWLEGVISNKPFPLRPGFADRLGSYAVGEHRLIEQTRDMLCEYRRSGSMIAVWGMATKGTEFVELVDPDRLLIDRCIDINARKQGRHTPLTARRIDPPDALRELAGNIVVVVMNPNYLDEIRRTCRQMGVNATCISV